MVNFDINKLKIAMANKAMNCPDLAIASGLSINTISEYVSGKRTATTKSLGKIAVALGVDVKDIIKN